MKTTTNQNPALTALRHHCSKGEPITEQPAPHVTLAQQVRPLLVRLNGNYGAGDVGAIQLSLAGEGSFEQVRFACRVRYRRFRIRHTAESLTVYALGHQVSS